MSTSQHYALKERVELVCSWCHGKGCGICQEGVVCSYTLERGHPAFLCRLGKHRLIGNGDPVNSPDELPRVQWCLRPRCGWQRVQTMTPEAYDGPES